MKKKFLVFLVFIFLSCAGFSQNILRGRVISKETQKPLPSASVYLNNTSLGVTTNEKGLFVLPNIQQGKVTRVVSCIGYETFVKFIDPVSQFVFMHKRPVYVLNNGYYYDVFDLKITGYWAWWETMANKLPYDYFPDKN